MSRQRPADEGLLFDLPLDPAAARRPPAEPATPAEDDQPALPLVEQAVEGAEDEPADDRAAPAPTRRRRASRRPGRAGPGPRLIAGLTDLGVCAAVLLVLLIALLALGVRPAWTDWPAGSVFLLTFSFLYSVLPLAFWGRTPGMALAGLRATSADGRPLSFRQAVLKWLGGVLTVALVGLPLLLALGGRSLSDLISGARTRPLGPTG